MHYKNIHLIYCSPTHTSARIARAIAEGMGGTTRRESDITHRTPDPEELVADVVAIFAVPVYAGRVAPVALERLHFFKGNNTPAIAAVLYGNRDYDDALLELADTLATQGFAILAAGAFIGEHSFSRPGFPVAEGRPDEEDIALAIQFGKDASKKLEAAASPEVLPELAIRGNRPYKTPGKSTPQSPTWNASLCTFCDTCVNSCPVSAISLKGDDLRSDPVRCIKCCACVKECPTGALAFDTPFTAVLAKNFAARKQPELFL